MHFERDISSPEDLPFVAKELLETFKDHRLFLFEAQMGMGKTTFIKELCKQLGSTDHLSSPTYALINEYHSHNTKLFHFDLYRLKNSTELFDIGFDDYLNSANYCFIEWPEMALPFLKDEKVVHLKIEFHSAKRILRAETY